MRMFFFNKVEEVTLKEQLFPFDKIEENIKLKKILSNFSSISSKDLNYLVSCIVEKLGYDTQIIDGFNDKGIDIIGFKNKKRCIAIQCKAWNPQKNTQRISIKDVQAFKGKFLSDGYNYGLFVTTHYFTDNALEESSDNLLLIDRHLLMYLCAKYFPMEMANISYYNSIDYLNNCPVCKQGKMLKLFSVEKKKYYYVCESCKKMNPGYKFT